MPHTRCFLVVWALTLLPLASAQAAEAPGSTLTPAMLVPRELSASTGDDSQDAVLARVLSAHGLTLAEYLPRYSADEMWDCEAEGAILFLAIMAMVGADFALKQSYRTGQIHGIIGAKIGLGVAIGAVGLAEALFFKCVAFH